MAEKYKFFNSGIGDARMYEASDFADYFGSLLSTGFLHTNEIPGMLVTVETGTLNTVVSPGKAIMKGHMYENTTPLTLAHDIPEPSMDRIDRVVLRLNLQNAERNIKLHVRKGMPGANPVPPTLQRDNFIYELSLARIRVRANTVQLLSSDLVDERLIDDLGGLVSWLPKIPTSQLQQQWDDFMASVTDTGFATAENFIAHKKDDTSHVYYADDTGTANVKVVSISSAPALYKKGLAVSFTNKFENTGAVTLNVNGLGPMPVIKANGLALIAGNLKAGSIYTVRFNGTSFVLQGEGGSGDATASDLLSGKKASTDAGDIVGAMPNHGAKTITPGTSNQAIPLGYHNGGGNVQGDASLVAGSIKKGVSIFGVDGTVDIAALGGKRSASGTVTVGSTKEQFRDPYNVVVSDTYYSVVIAGLDFIPSRIAITFSSSGLFVFSHYDSSNYYSFPNPPVHIYNYDAINGHAYSKWLHANYAPSYVVQGGFKIPVLMSGGQAMTWWAYE